MSGKLFDLLGEAKTARKMTRVRRAGAATGRESRHMERTSINPVELFTPELLVMLEATAVD